MIYRPESDLRLVLHRPLPQLHCPPVDPDAAYRVAHREGVWIGLLFGVLLGAAATLLCLPLAEVLR